MVSETVLASIISLVFGGSTAAILGQIIKGRKEAGEIHAKTVAIEEKLGPEVDSITLGNAAAALEMQLKVNESQAQSLVRKDEELAQAYAIIKQRDEQIMLLEQSLSLTRDRLDAVELSLKATRDDLDNLERELEKYRTLEAPKEP